MYNLQILSCAILPFVWSVSAAPGLVVRGGQSSNFKTTTQTPSGNQDPSPNTQAAHVLTLEQRSTTGSATSATYVQSLRQNSQVNGVYGTSAVTSVESGLVFVTEIGVGNENFTVVVDTGSSDTWLVKTGFACSKGTTEAACDFGKTYDESSTFQAIDNENYDQSYSDGEYLFGGYGKDEVTVAGITVRDQQIAAVQSANWNGDGVSSGVLGLGFPGNTKAYSGTSQLNDDTQIQYNPFFTSATTEGSVAPLFSLAISRDTTGGMLAIGGLPAVAYVPVFASTPFQLLTASSTSATAGAKPDYTFYTITTNGFEYQSAQTNWNVGSWLTYFGNPNDASEVQVIIDSGTTVNYLPQVTADRVNALFEPAATYDAQLGYYTVDCNAKAPEFGVRIGQEIFYINPLDNILKVTATGCITGISRTGTGGHSTLGTVFLKNVLAVFDVGASQMRFAAREYS